MVNLSENELGNMNENVFDSELTVEVLDYDDIDSETENDNSECIS